MMVKTCPKNQLSPKPRPKLQKISWNLCNSLTPLAAGAVTALIAGVLALVPRPTLAQTHSETAPSGLIQIPVGSGYYSPYALVVDKKSRLLGIWQQSPEGLKQIESYPADLGKNAGQKSARNDYKTPEGIYFLTAQKDGPGLDFNLYGKRAFTTDYPNYFDRLDGKTGDGIWLHAVPDHVPLSRGSRGCVVVRNEVILKISQYIKLGRTPILIQDQAELKPVPMLESQKQKILSWLENWKTSWESKNLDSYMAHYASDFRSNNMNRAQWQTYKSHLNELYKSISVRISQPLIFTDRNRAVVRFLQEYTSELKTDTGEKVLYIREKDSAFEIVGENWTEESPDVVHAEMTSMRTPSKTVSTASDCSANVASATGLASGECRASADQPQAPKN